MLSGVRIHKVNNNKNNTQSNLQGVTQGKQTPQGQTQHRISTGISGARQLKIADSKKQNSNVSNLTPSNQYNDQMNRTGISASFGAGKPMSSTHNDVSTMQGQLQQVTGNSSFVLRQKKSNQQQLIPGNALSPPEANVRSSEQCVLDNANYANLQQAALKSKKAAGPLRRQNSRIRQVVTSVSTDPLSTNPVQDQQGHHKKVGSYVKVTAAGIPQDGLAPVVGPNPLQNMALQQNGHIEGLTLSGQASRSGPTGVPSNLTSVTALTLVNQPNQVINLVQSANFEQRVNTAALNANRSQHGVVRASSKFQSSQHSEIESNGQSKTSTTGLTQNSGLPPTSAPQHLMPKRSDIEQYVARHNQASKEQSSHSSSSTQGNRQRPKSSAPMQQQLSLQDKQLMFQKQMQMIQAHQQKQATQQFATPQILQSGTKQNMAMSMPIGMPPAAASQSVAHPAQLVNANSSSQGFFEKRNRSRGLPPNATGQVAPGSAGIQSSTKKQPILTSTNAAANTMSPCPPVLPKSEQSKKDIPTLVPGRGVPDFNINPLLVQQQQSLQNPKGPGLASAGSNAKQHNTDFKKNIVTNFHPATMPTNGPIQSSIMQAKNPNMTQGRFPVQYSNTAANGTQLEQLQMKQMHVAAFMAHSQGMLQFQQAQQQQKTVPNSALPKCLSGPSNAIGNGLTPSALKDDQVMRATRYQNYSNIVGAEDPNNLSSHQQLAHQRIESQSFNGGITKETDLNISKQIKSFDKRPVVNATTVPSESSFMVNPSAPQTIEVQNTLQQIDIKNKENLTATQKKTQRKQHLNPNSIGSQPANGPVTNFALSQTQQSFNQAVTNNLEHASRPQTSQRSAQAALQLSQAELEAAMTPQTPKYFKNTFRQAFNRRATHITRPVLLMTFQGVLGDFFKDHGISMRQDHLISKAYVQSIQGSAGPQNSGAPGGLGGQSIEQQQNCMWIRIGCVDGLRYLCSHFQVVIFSRDVQYEDYGQNFSQVQMIQNYFKQQDIAIDGIYGGQTPYQQNNDDTEDESKGLKNKKPAPMDKNQSKGLKRPHRQGEIWEDYKQIYLDFGLKTETQVRDRVLFINSFDCDYNAKIEEMKFDSQGYFLIDTKEKPARPLVAGVPLTYETKEKGIDLSDKGTMFQFKHLNKNKVQTKEMPVCILVPNPRTAYNQQLSFASVAKTIITLSFFGQAPQSFDLDSATAIRLSGYLNSMRFLQEFDIKVQSEQCLLQCNPSKQGQLQAAAQQSGPEQRGLTSSQQRRNGADQRKQAANNQNNSKLKDNRSSNTSIEPRTGQTTNSNGRPRSSASHGRILQAQRPQDSANIQNEVDSPEGEGQANQSTGETMKVPLSESLFQNISWSNSFDAINDTGMLTDGGHRDILGLVPVRSNLIWRYFLSLLKKRSNIKQHREKRVGEVKKLLEKLDAVQVSDDGKTIRQAKISEIYDMLKQVPTNGNPLTNMMARNLKVFIKIYAEVKRKCRLELDNFISEDDAVQMVDEKMAQLEKQNLESRIFILGANKPNQFFNTHACVKIYEKVNVSMNMVLPETNQQAAAKKEYNSRALQDNVNTATTTASFQLNKQANGSSGSNAKPANSYNSVSTIEHGSSTYDPSSRSLMEMSQNGRSQKKGGQAASSQQKQSSNAAGSTANTSQNYGRKKQSSNGLTQAANGSGSSAGGNGSAINMANFSTQSSAVASRRKVASRGGGEHQSATADASAAGGMMSRRSNQSGSQDAQNQLRHGSSMFT